MADPPRRSLIYWMQLSGSRKLVRNKHQLKTPKEVYRVLESGCVLEAMFLSIYCISGHSCLDEFVLCVHESSETF